MIYEVSEKSDDFFPNNLYIERYLDSERNLPSDFFVEELDRFRAMDNPQERGRMFDKYIGLLFQQIKGAEVRLKAEPSTGEFDVHIVCLEAPDWLHRLAGSHTLIENKWEKDPVETGDIHKFYSKASDIAGCEKAYFVSMSGFSRGRGRKLGALSKIKNMEKPSIVDVWEEDVEQIARNGSPESFLRNRLLD